jgi:uncharacterized membrane protein YsdA (DUF1294 family)
VNPAQLYICRQDLRRFAEEREESVLLGVAAISPLDVLLFWGLVLSLVALVLMGVDKASAKMRKARVRESTFGAIALFGGFAGVILGGLIFHHKTSKPRFWLPVILALVLWGAGVFLALHFHWIAF